MDYVAREIMLRFSQTTKIEWGLQTQSKSSNTTILRQAPEEPAPALTVLHVVKRISGRILNVGT